MKDNKKATPRQENSLDINNIINLRFSEWKTLERLLKSPCNRFELGSYILSGYAPNDVKALRDKGYRIHTEYVPYLRSDGKETRIGIYHLEDEEKARIALRVFH